MLQGRLWIHVTVGELKTAPTRKDASLSGCHMVYTGNDGAGHFCQCNFPVRIYYGRELLLLKKNFRNETC
jgi:hypothetical protein